MRRIMGLVSGALATALTLAGCSAEAPPPTGGGASPGPGAAARAGPDPCGVALAPHTGASPEDQDIIRWQQAARGARDPGPAVERLGWAFVIKARTSFDPGFYTLAERAALCLEAKQPGSLDALLLRGHVLHNLHRFQEGEALARRLVAERGRSFDHGLLGDLLMEQGKLGEAAAAYQRMMDERPSPQAYTRAAHIRWLTGDLAGARQLMRMAVGTSGFRDPEAAAWAHVRLALYALQAAEPREAHRHLDRALALQADYPPALLARGRALLGAGRAAESLAPLTLAARRNPLPEYQWVLIEALRALGRPAEADAVHVDLVARGAATDRRTLVLYLATAGREAATAVRLAEEELAVRGDVFTLDALAWALHRAGRRDEARRLSAQALAAGTQDARLYYHAGVIAAASGDGESARRWLGRAATLRALLLPSEQRDLDRHLAGLTRPGVRPARGSPDPGDPHHPAPRRTS